MFPARAGLFRGEAGGGDHGREGRALVRLLNVSFRSGATSVGLALLDTTASSQSPTIVFRALCVIQAIPFVSVVLFRGLSSLRLMLSRLDVAEIRSELCDGGLSSSVWE